MQLTSKRRKVIEVQQLPRSAAVLGAHIRTLKWHSDVLLGKSTSWALGLLAFSFHIYCSPLCRGQSCCWPKVICYIPIRAFCATGHQRRRRQNETDVTVSSCAAQQKAVDVKTDHLTMKLLKTNGIHSWIHLQACLDPKYNWGLKSCL